MKTCLRWLVCAVLVLYVSGVRTADLDVARNRYYKKHESRRLGEVSPIGQEFCEGKAVCKRVAKSTTQTLSDIRLGQSGSSKTEREFIRTIAITHKELMYEALYNDVFGFYSSGKVMLGSEKEKVSFTTQPETLSPNFGAMLAYNCYAIYRSMILAGDLGHGQTFCIVELGAGNGTLAYDILGFIEHCAQEEEQYGYKTHWREFFTVVEYVIGELSPALAKRQAEKNKRFVHLGKIKIINLDARKIDDVFGGNKITGMFISNELPDAFPVHKIVKKGESFNVVVALAVCALQDLEKLCDHEDKIQNILDKSCAIRATYANEIPEEVSDNAVILSKKDYFELKELAACQSRSIDRYIMFYEKEKGIARFEQLGRYIKRNSKYLLHKAYGTTGYINDGVEEFMRSIANILEKGFIITIDYGYATAHIDDRIEYFKTPGYGKLGFYPEGIAYSIYKAPGDYDITTKLNFTDLSLVGRVLGIDSICYGPEKLLFGKRLMVDRQKGVYMKPFEVDTDALISKDAKHMPSKELIKQSDCHAFKVLIQKTKNTKSSFCILTDQEDL